VLVLVFYLGGVALPEFAQLIANLDLIGLRENSTPHRQVMYWKSGISPYRGGRSNNGADEQKNRDNAGEGLHGKKLTYLTNPASSVL